MRTLVVSIFLLMAETLSAQNYQQNAPPIQQTQAASDCYTRNLDKGNAALLRGETREALSFFIEAKNCSNAQNNARRQSEIDIYIARYETQLGIKKTSADDIRISSKSSPNIQKRSFSNEPPMNRRHYTANQNFLKDTSDDCFHRMANEADRAFRLKFWEDAAALYRAAKNCSDADQNDRQTMSDKITDCRNAAENELFAKQQEAERQARHAIAANRADDAQELLQSTDRSLAFRLAYFANQYIAPEDNSDCVQAMFDTWYYQPVEDFRDRPNALFHPVFCYELADNLNAETQLKFVQQKDSSQWLWAFDPKTGDISAWEFPSMKLMQSYSTGENNGYQGFGFSPVGEQLFWGKKFFDLRQGAFSVRIDVPSIAHWCFNARGDEFFFENVDEQKISVLNLKEAFAQQYTRKHSRSNAAIQSPVVPREFMTGVPAGLLAMEYFNGKFWLGFSDRVEIMAKPAPGKPWRREKIIRFDGVQIPESLEQKDIQLVLFPKEGFAMLNALKYTWTIPLRPKTENDTAQLKSRGYESMYPLAVSASAHQIACQYNGNYSFGAFWLMDAFTGDTLVRQHLPTNSDFEILKGSFSDDGRWLAARSNFGNLNVWALQNAQPASAVLLSNLPEGRPVFSPDGTSLFVTHADTLSVFNTEPSNKPKRFWKNNGQPPPYGTSNDWVMVQVSPDSAEATHLTDDRSLRFPLKNKDFPVLYTFDSEGEKLIAYLSDWNKVEVRSLKSADLKASRVFEGGMINELKFVPGTENLLIVQNTSFTESTVKLWSPLHTESKPGTFRLHGYPISALAIDQNGNKAAFSNGKDIRVFDLKNIENEVLKIRAKDNDPVQAIDFRANSNLLAAAYSTGKVVFWNVQTGQASLQLQVVPKNFFENGIVINAIGFSDHGTVLQIAVSNGQLLAYALDPGYIRSQALDQNRPLQSFSEEDIIRYDLEAALYYPGNFERLATSEDAPLVNSFFQHFRIQAIESNNIVQVRDYCERAFYLYERLDQLTKKLWLQDMSLMYEDYARKLLLRNDIKKASDEVTFIKREFNYEPVLLNAHIALLQRKFKEAAALYSKHLLVKEDGTPLPFGAQYQFGNVENELTQLRDYELIDSAQIACFCGTVSLSGRFSALCPLGKDYPSDFLSFTDRTHWGIAQNLNAAFTTQRFAAKTKLLEEAQQKAKILVAQNPEKELIWLKTINLELAATQRKWGVFEQYSAEALPHFEKSVHLLAEMNEVKTNADTSRLSLLSATRLAWGKHLLEAGNVPDAIAQFELGLVAAQLLSEYAYQNDTSLLVNYYDNLVGPLYENLGTAYLLQGNTTEARQAYELSGKYYFTYGLNSLYLATVAVLENESTQAFLDYGGINTASDAAIALYQISRLAEQFPAKRSQIEAFDPVLRSALRDKNKRLVNVETDYWYAKLKVYHFAAQSLWDSAVLWSTVAMRSAELGFEQLNAEEGWKRIWLNEHVDLPYFLLLGAWNKPAALAECIRYVERAEDYLVKLDAEDPFYFENREYLKPNLAHALVLRNNSGDRDRAISLYKEFINSNIDPRGYDNMDLLEKDFNDLKHLGAPWPTLPRLEETRKDN